MHWIAKYLIACSQFDNFAEIHNGDTIANVPHYRQIMSNEEIGEAMPPLQIAQHRADDRAVDPASPVSAVTRETDQIRPKLFRLLTNGCGGVAALEHLDLARNPLQHADVEFSGCRALSLLSLASCGLTALPREPWYLPSLNHLNLSGNKLSVLDPWVGRFRTLEHLQLADNQLRDLPNTLEMLTQMRVLHLARNPLGARSQWGFDR